MLLAAPDFKIEIVIDISQEVFRMGVATIGFAIACWAMIKIIALIAKSNERKE